MRRIGMTHDPADDFDHPRFPQGHRFAAPRALPESLDSESGYPERVTLPARALFVALGALLASAAVPALASASASRAEVVVELKAPPLLGACAHRSHSCATLAVTST